MEAVTFGETVAYVVNSPMKVVEKVGDVIAEFGMKLEREAKKASRPKEPVTEPRSGTQNTAKSKPNASPKSSVRSPKP